MLKVGTTRKLLFVLKLQLTKVTARHNLMWACVMRKAEECTRTEKRFAFSIAHWKWKYVFCHYLSFCFFNEIFIFVILCEGSVSLLASSSWGPQTGSVPTCKINFVQQEAEEHRRAEHSHQFPGAVSHSRTHWGINDDKPWPALLTGIIIML